MNRDPTPSATPAPSPIHDQRCKCWRCLDSAARHDHADRLTGVLLMLMSAMIMFGIIACAAIHLLALWATP